MDFPFRFRLPVSPSYCPVHPVFLTVSCDALGMFATGVTIVTARSAAGELVGLTASSFNSVSLTPPLVLWSLAHKAASMPVFAAGSHYAINVLCADQEGAGRSALPRATEDRWAGWHTRPA